MVTIWAQKLTMVMLWDPQAIISQESSLVNRTPSSLVTSAGGGGAAPGGGGRDSSEGASGGASLPAGAR